MVEFSDNNFFYFLSTAAQVYGALIGLSCLIYVYKSESVRENISRSIHSLNSNLQKVKDKNSDVDFHENLDINSLRNFIEKLRPHYDLMTYKSIINDHESLLFFSTHMSTNKKWFTRSNGVLIISLVSALLSLVVPVESSHGLKAGLMYLNIGLAIATLVVFFYFIRLLSKEVHQFNLSSD